MNAHENSYKQSFPYVKYRACENYLFSAEHCVPGSVHVQGWRKYAQKLLLFSKIVSRDMRMSVFSIPVQ